MCKVLLPFPVHSRRTVEPAYPLKEMPCTPFNVSASETVLGTCGRTHPVVFPVVQVRTCIAGKPGPDITVATVGYPLGEAIVQVCQPRGCQPRVPWMSVCRHSWRVVLTFRAHVR